MWKVQMGKMWREGHRRSPRISALDAWKAQAPRPPVPSRCRRMNSSSAAAGTTLAQNRKEQRHPHPEGPASRTRAKKKRKLRQLQDVAPSTPTAHQDPKSNDVQDVRKPSHENHPVSNDLPILRGEDNPKHEYTDQTSRMPRALQMPEKRTLELIIDILQRRDTHEIFAEPVDPNEVENYYEIIKEPMDFGTMRAKLHEGIYKSLAQFEYDVFLISRNAMHFNSTGTIYFRQARAIDELAKKVFHVLKTNPENFELEFSASRRRSGRRPQHEGRGSICSSSLKNTTNSRSGSMTLNVSPKHMPCSGSGSSNPRRAVRVKPSFLGTATHHNDGSEELPFGGGDFRGSIPSEADRRSAYKPWMSFLSENHTIVSTIYNNSKLLTCVNQQDIGHHRSLMLFVKDLGPTAQMVAKRKLSGCSTDVAHFVSSTSECLPEASNCQNYVTSTSNQWIPSALSNRTTVTTWKNLSRSERVDVGNAEGETASAGNKMGIGFTSVGMLSNSKDKGTFGHVRGDVYSRDGMDVLGVSESDKFQQHRKDGVQLVSHSSTADDREFSFRVSGLNSTDKLRTLKLEKSKKDDRPPPLDSGFKSCQSDALACMFNENYSMSSSSWSLPTKGISGFDQRIGSMHNLSLQSHCLGGTDEVAIAGVRGSIDETGWGLKSSEAWARGSPFIFDLPFLKTRLEEINSVGQDRFVQQNSGMQVAFVDRRNDGYHDSYVCSSSLDNGRASLAIQL